MDRFADHAYTTFMRGEPALTHLPLLLRYNVATSLANTAARLGIVEDVLAEIDVVLADNLRHRPLLSGLQAENIDRQRRRSTGGAGSAAPQRESGVFPRQAGTGPQHRLSGVPDCRRFKPPALLC